ncbi:MAG TPA: hypothetical protein VLW50_31685 [Streptosporangiaceae bacterium]|nr:hypothetical protein [Streptosporangiaceae bacterium]
MAGNNSRDPDGKATGNESEKVTTSTKVNVAFPLSQIKIQEPSSHLVALTALVDDLAGLLAETAPGPKAESLRRRAHDLASSLG